LVIPNHISLLLECSTLRVCSLAWI